MVGEEGRTFNSSGKQYHSSGGFHRSEVACSWLVWMESFGDGGFEKLEDLTGRAECLMFKHALFAKLIPIPGIHSAKQDETRELTYGSRGVSGGVGMGWGFEPKEMTT